MQAIFKPSTEGKCVGDGEEANLSSILTTRVSVDNIGLEVGDDGADIEEVGLYIYKTTRENSVGSW